MKSKTILGADGATKMRQITVGIHGKGGETGIKAIMLLTALINDLKQCKTPQEVYDGYLQITGYCKCCVDCDFIEEKDADELMHLAAYLAGNEQRHNRKRVIRYEKSLYMQPVQGERRRRAGQKHRLCAAADTAGIRGGFSAHYAAFIYDAVHGREKAGRAGKGHGCWACAAERLRFCYCWCEIRHNRGNGQRNTYSKYAGDCGYRCEPD